jgi:hypothetical protein
MSAVAAIRNLAKPTGHLDRNERDERMTAFWVMAQTRRGAGIAIAMAGFLFTASAGHSEAPVMPPAANKPAAGPAIPLVSHRAIYDVSLLKSIGSKSPTSARGRVSYEFTGSGCDGYSQVFRQLTEIQPGEGATRLSDMRSATFEDAEGTSFSFDVKTTVDSNPPDVVDGRASKQKSDLLAIQLSKPASQNINVGSDVLFPTAHLKRIIAAGKAGQRMLEVKVFDGSDDGTKVYDTTTIIGRPLTTPTDDGPAARVPGMDGVRRWPVTISYFEPGKTDEEPVYRLGFELFENGVSRALRFDYGDFVLAGRMTSMELLPAKRCDH